MTQPPKIEFRKIEPLQDYYEDRQGNQYSVARLLDDAKDLPEFDVPLAGLDLDACAWSNNNLFWSAWHVKKVMAANLNFPILLDWNGSIVDGRHRIVKALMQGKRVIKARRMTWKPEPDRPAGNAGA